MTKKRNLLLVSLLLVFGLAVAAPSLFAQVVLQGSYNTNNYIRNEGDAEAVGTVALTVTNTSAGTIKAGSTITVTYNAIIAANGSSSAPTYAVGIKCSSTWPTTTDACPSFANGDVTVTTTTTPPSSSVVLYFPDDVAGVIASSPAAGISIAVRVAAQGLAYNSPVTAVVSSFVPAAYILTNSISIFSYATQPFLVATVGAKTATTPTVYALGQVLSCIGATGGPGVDLFTISIAENWPNALTSLADETALETDTNSGAPTNGSNILITLSGIPSGVTVAMASTAVAPCTAASPPTGTTACPGGALTFGTAVAGTESSAGVQSFYYPVTHTNTLAAENAAFYFTFSSAGALPVGLPPITAAVTLTDAATSVSTNMPIFTSPEATGLDVVSFGDCVTNLMFPYVNCVNLPGSGSAASHWGTGIDIANTTTDPFGLTISTKAGTAAPQKGSCTFYFYPSNAPTSGAVVWPTPVIPSGGSYAFDVGSSVPAFNGAYGYAIAICDFQNANGYTFIFDNYGIGEPQVSAMYLPYIIPNPSLYHRNPAGDTLGEFAIAPYPPSVF
jgi:hypothetical protein